MSPLFYITDNAVRSTVRPAFPIRKKTAFPQSTRHGGKPVAIPVPTSPPCLSPQAEKSGRQFVPLFLSGKNGVFRHQRGMTATNRCNTRSDFSSPSQSTAYLVSFKFLRPVFSKRRQRFFPFLTKRFSGDGFSLFLVGKHQEKHALQIKNDNGHFSFA